MARKKKSESGKVQVSETWLDPESGAVVPEEHEVVKSGEVEETEKSEDSAPNE